jgi:hypothetical protein
VWVAARNEIDNRIQSAVLASRAPDGAPLRMPMTPEVQRLHADVTEPEAWSTTCREGPFMEIEGADARAVTAATRADPRSAQLDVIEYTMRRGRRIGARMDDVDSAVIEDVARTMRRALPGAKVNVLCRFFPRPASP